MTTNWRVDNMQRCYLDRERWIADIIYEYKPGFLARNLLMAKPRTWKKSVRSNRNGQWYWMPKVTLLNVYDHSGLYFVNSHEWELSMMLDRLRDEAIEREQFHKSHEDKTELIGLPKTGPDDTRVVEVSGVVRRTK